MMKKYNPHCFPFPTGSTGLLFTFILCSLLSTADIFAGDIRVKTEIEVLKESGFRMLQGKRVGLITNPTGVDNNLKSTIDILHEAPNVQLVALYGPEHGVRGDVHAGDKVSDFKDPNTGVPVYSLYGATRKPTKEMLEGVDLLVYDIQDIGCRSYTYISTLYLAMQAAAENDIGFVVLDRPNPLGGLKVEGNLVEEGFFSFVSQLKIPYVYGLTCGELAEMIKGEGMIRRRVDQCRGVCQSTECGTSSRHHLSSCPSETLLFRGTGKNYQGVQIYLTDFNKARLSDIQFHVMEVAARLYPDHKVFDHAPDNRFDMFDKVCGTDFIRKEFARNHRFEDISAYWSKDEVPFRKLSKKYYLYR